MDHMDMRIDSLHENLKFVVQYVQQQMQKAPSENKKFQADTDSLNNDTSSSYHVHDMESRSYKTSIKLELPKFLGHSTVVVCKCGYKARFAVAKTITNRGWRWLPQL